MSSPLDEGCRPERLSDYLDGSLDVETAETLDAHLAACGPCRGLLAQLEQVRSMARTLEPMEPSKDLWPEIVQGIEQRHVIDLEERRRTEAEVGRVIEPRRGVFLSPRQLSVAAAAVVVLTAGGAWGLSQMMSSAPVVPQPAAALVPTTSGSLQMVSDPGVDAAVLEVAELQRLLDAGRDRLDPNTIRVLERNLVFIDHAIAESLDALAMDPENGFVTEYLRRSYDRKVTYLREATALLDLAD